MDLESLNVSALLTTLIVLGVTVLPFVVGVYLAKALRMEDYGWKIGLILTSIIAGAAITFMGWPPKLGIDLAGGTILIYEIDEEATKSSGLEDGDEITPADVALVLRPRLNPGGSGDIQIRPYGEKQIEIIIPNAPDEEVENLKRLISTSGYLEFRIVVNQADYKHKALVDLAEAQRASTDLRVRRSKQLYTPGARVGVDQPQAVWVNLGITENDDPGEQKFRVNGFGGNFRMIVRDPATGQWITFTQADAASFGIAETTLEKELARLGDGLSAVEYVRDVLKVKQPEVLVATNEPKGREVKGKHLASARSDVNLEDASPSVSFTMTAEGSRNMALLTSANVDANDKRNELYRYLGIVLDGTLLSAPSLQSQISNNGQITGRFEQEEVDRLVAILREGHLPAVLNPNPTSENNIDATLGASTIRKGSIAIGASLIAVLIFMVVYYRFAGVVACFALTINLLLIVAFMIAFKAAFTLPGLAGLVLTVGMSVDANVLIFERIREERKKGAALRMAIRNGFGRATTTIVDANLTTLITAIVLYGIGTEQVQGFAVTLILGILMSMFSAIFCARVVFDIAEKQRWPKDFKMMQILGETRLNFIGKRVIAAGISVVLIAVGVSAIVARGADIFDIDFTGGTSAQIKLVTALDDETVRTRIEDNLVSAYNKAIDDELAATNDAEAKKELESLRREKLEITVSGLSIEGEEKGLLWQVYSSIPESELLKDALANVFTDENGKSMLVSYHLDVENVEPVAMSLPVVPSAETPTDVANPPAESTSPEEPATPPEAGTTPANPAPEADPNDPRQAEPKPPIPPLDDTSRIQNARDQLALADDALTEVALLQEEAAPDGDTENPTADSSPVAENPTGAEAPTTDDTPPVDAAPVDDTASPPESGTVDDDRTSSLPTEDEVPATPEVMATKVTLKFDHGVSGETVQGMVADTADKLNMVKPEIVFIDPAWDGVSEELQETWTIQLGVEPDTASPLLTELKTEIDKSPVFFSVSKIGGTVAGKARTAAIWALMGSLIGIVAYIWFRFQRVVYGLAAVVALVHDVMIVVGAIAISAYLAPALGFLMIEEFKISLPIVAALLTIIGYSLNDTIVVFDRIREVKGKNPSLTGDMINTSINQTLSRTLLTSLTTLIVVLILYIRGGEGIHGFAFALLIGVFIGTYSSVFVASPILLWLGGDKSTQSSQAS